MRLPKNFLLTATACGFLTLAPGAWAQTETPPPSDYEGYRWEPGDSDMGGDEGAMGAEPEGGEDSGAAGSDGGFRGGEGGPGRGGFGGRGFGGGRFGGRGGGGGGFGGGFGGGRFGGRGGGPGAAGGGFGGGFRGGAAGGFGGGRFGRGGAGGAFGRGRFGGGGAGGEGGPGAGAFGGRRGRNGGKGGQAGQAMLARVRELDPKLADEMQELSENAPPRARMKMVREVARQMRQFAKESFGPGMGNPFRKGKGKGKGKGGDEAGKGLFQEVALMELRTLVDAVKAQRDGVEPKAAEAKLRPQIEALFDKKLALQESRVKEMESKLAELKGQVSERRGHKKQIVDQRLGELLERQRRFTW